MRRCYCITSAPATGTLKSAAGAAGADEDLRFLIGDRFKGWKPDSSRTGRRAGKRAEAARSSRRKPPHNNAANRPKSSTGASHWVPRQR